MLDLSKLDWLANWQNAASLIAAIAAGIWLGPLDATHFIFVFIVAFALARLMTALVQAVWKRLTSRGSGSG